MNNKKGYVLAIDAGTGSGRAVLFDTEGHQVASGQEEWTHKSDARYPNSMEFDTEYNWRLLCRCIHRAFNESSVAPRDVLGVSATSMREGIVLYDADGKELWGCANVDARAANEVRDLKEQYPGLEKEFYGISGQTFALGALPRLLWVKRHMPEIYERTRKISMLSDWVLFRLSGEIVSDPSNAAPSLLNLNIDPTRCGKAEIFRALEENAAIVAASNLEQIFAFTGIETDMLIFAGGASKGPLWCQILADVTGKKVRIPVVKEATALGCAIAAGIGAGLFDNMIQAADSLVRWENDYMPNAENYQLYQEVRSNWTKAYAAQLSLVDAHVTQSMWKAPGL